MCDTVATTTTSTPTAAAGSGTGTGTGGAAGDTATTMEERTRQSCCRLCIAPASECISIINSYAADKEPLATKIHNCVNIKVSKPNVRRRRIELPAAYVIHSSTSTLTTTTTTTSIRIRPAAAVAAWLLKPKPLYTLLAPIPLCGSEPGQMAGSSHTRHCCC